MIIKIFMRAYGRDKVSLPLIQEGSALEKGPTLPYPTPMSEIKISIVSFLHWLFQPQTENDIGLKMQSFDGGDDHWAPDGADLLVDVLRLPVGSGHPSLFMATSHMTFSLSSAVLA